jgi:DNA replication initiation complex subunit (GINS family)
MGDSEINITYETLFDFLRREKNNEDLQKLPDQFYADVMSYLRGKFDIIDKNPKGDNSFSYADHERINEDIISIRKVLKELYNRREKKVIKMAQDTAMLNAPIANIDNMIDYEFELYNRSVKLFRQFRNRVLVNLLDAKEPGHIAKLCDEKENEVFQDDQTFNEPLQKESEKSKEYEDKTEINGINLVFLKDISEFVGRELEVYGPFRKDDVSYLPEEIASILIEQGSARKA